MASWKIKRYAALGTALLTAISSSASAFWDPEEVLEKDVSSIDEAAYIELKDKVLASLKNSWCSVEKTHLLMDLVLLEKPQVCVEIGAFIGSSSLPIAATLKFLGEGHLFAVDAWSNQVATRYWPDTDPNKAWWGALDMNAVQNMFNSLMEQWDLSDTCTPIALPSEEALSQFDKIDFLHLDGDYSEIGALKDVELYLPKVKSGGYVLLSNFFTMVNGKQPKLAAFCKLLESCDILSDIEKENVILFRKY